MVWVAGMVLLTLTLAVHSASAQVTEQEDSGSKGDVSTESSPNLGQQKGQEVVRSEADGAREAGKREPETGRERQHTNSPAASRPERPQRIERPPRPERPHR
jgi:hypothetical protein